MKNVTCSEVERTHSVLRFLCPIQSWSQFLSVVVTYVLGLSVVALVIHLLDPSEPLAYIMVCASLGGSWALFAALPARIELTTSTEARHFVKSVQEKIMASGYREVKAIPGGMHFRSKLPRWLRWAENEVNLVAHDHAIELSGPAVALRLLKRIFERSDI